MSRDNNGRILVTARLMDVIVVHPGDKRRPARIIREAVAAILPPPASANIGGCGITRFNIDDHPGDPTPYAGIWNELFVDG